MLHDFGAHQADGLVQVGGVGDAYFDEGADCLVAYRGVDDGGRIHRAVGDDDHAVLHVLDDRVAQGDFRNGAFDALVHLDVVADAERLGEGDEHTAHDVLERFLRSQADGHGHDAGAGQDGLADLLHARDQGQEGRDAHYIYGVDDDVLEEAEVALVDPAFALPLDVAAEEVLHQRDQGLREGVDQEALHDEGDGASQADAQDGSVENFL